MSLHCSRLGSGNNERRNERFCQLCAASPLWWFMLAIGRHCQSQYTPLKSEHKQQSCCWLFQQQQEFILTCRTATEGRQVLPFAAYQSVKAPGCGIPPFEGRLMNERHGTYAGHVQTCLGPRHE